MKTLKNEKLDQLGKGKAIPPVISRKQTPKDPRGFRRPQPHELVATNIPGAFATPAAPHDFDPNTASKTALLQHGIFWQRPKKGDEPHLLAAWDKVFAKKWDPKKRIIPHLEPQPGKTHNLKSPPVKKNNTAYNSNSWAGSVVNGNWTTATGYWIIPTASKPSEAQGTEGGWNSASWVGIDGFNTNLIQSNDVLQAGIEQRVDAKGNASYVAWYEWFCSVRKTVLGDTSPVSPSIASLNGRLYIAWKGDGNDHLNVMYSSDNGANFGNKLVSGETSPQAPSLCVHNNNLYIAWKGDGNDNLNVAIVNQAGNAITGFSNKVTLGDTSPLTPVLASLNGRLYIAWRGDGNDNLNLMCSTDNGHTFGNKFTSGETSPQAPGLCAHNGNLYITWKGDGNDHLNVATVNLSGNSITGFSNKVVLGDTSPKSPALASLNGRLYLSWKGDGNDNLNVMYSADNGHSFGNKYTSGETSPQAPGLGIHNGNLYITWKGDGNDNLNVSQVGIDGTIIDGFTTPGYVFQTNITNFPVSPGQTVYCSVQYITNGTAGYINFANQTTGQHFSITLLPPPGASFAGNCVEWIMEAPDGGIPTSSLPKFTPINFTSAIGCGPNNTVANPKTGDTVNVVNGAATLTAVAVGDHTVTISFTG